MDCTYLLINFFTILVPFAFSFHPKLKFYKTWPAFFPAVLITGIVFIVWDIIFTRLGVWGFNPQYLMGIEIGGLPLEEILFFLCIPYACVFTWHCFKLFLPKHFSKTVRYGVSAGFIIFLVIAGFVYIGNIYTAVTFFSLALLLALAVWPLKIRWLSRFYIIYTVLLIPFLIVNGLLTGLFLDQPVVWYNETEIIGLRIFTIPFEDVFYGMELILTNVLLYEYFKNRKA